MSTDASGGAAQLTALAALHRLFSEHDIMYWLFGGWAVDFHLGRVTRNHDDIDIAVRSADADRVDELLGQTGWVVEGGTEGYRTYRSGDVQLDVAWVGDGDADWPEGAFGHETGELGGYRVRVVGRAAMVVDKSAGARRPGQGRARRCCPPRCRYGTRSIAILTATHAQHSEACPRAPARRSSGS